MMRNLLWITLIGFLLMACSKQTEKETKVLLNTDEIALEIPDTTVDKSTLHYNRKNSLWTLNDELYSGFAVDYFQGNTLKEKFGILNGRKQNEYFLFYPDGHNRQLANYHKGKLHGEKKSWSADSTHVLISHLNYYKGKLHGEQKKWYVTGGLFKKLNLNMGKEEGMQQAFRKNGVVFANYEAIKGRSFGLKKAALCLGLEDEMIQDQAK